MKESFYASACIYGIHGGGAYLVDDGFRFRCQKLTIADEYKDLLIPYEKIKSVFAARWVLFIPTTVIETQDRKTYRFLIFNRKKFIRCIEEQLQ
jgi:hypothetical protein